MTSSARQRPSAMVWSLLMVPFGIQNGFVRVGLAFVATRRGLDITDGALLVAAQFATQWLKWAWAPLVDLTLTLGAWYRLATILSAASLLAACALPMTPRMLPVSLAVVALGGVANSVVGMAVEALLVSHSPRGEVGRASGWFQAGNLSGVAIGGGLGLLMLERLPAPWMTGAMLGGLVLLPSVLLRSLPAAASTQRGDARLAWRALWADLRDIVRSAPGRTAVLASVLPIGTGAAFSVLAQSSIAGTWHASADDVAVVHGVLAGAAAIAGSVTGGSLCARWSPLRVYASLGVVHAVVAIGMALLPHTLPLFVAGVLAYAFVAGAIFVAFTAYVLATIGTGAVATKFTIFASLANLPIWWLGLVLGWVAQRRGPAAMLGTEAVLGSVSAVVVAILASSPRSAAPLQQ